MADTGLGALEPLALVLTGGGARSAYQVGVLRGIARQYPEIEFPIMTGVSAGAINATFIASRQEPFEPSTQALLSFWKAVKVENVFRTGGFGFFRNAVRWGLRLVGGGKRFARTTRGLVDTAPLQELLERAFSAGPDGIPGIAGNVASGRLYSLAVTATSYTTGSSVTWCQGHGLDEWERDWRKGVRSELGVGHVMASAALPLLFPAVNVGDEWYGDGGIRLSAPLSPAVHLGASKILAISTRRGRRTGEAEQVEADGYPPTARVAGLMLNSVFLDLLDADALRLARINQLLAKVPPDAETKLRPIDLLVIRPSEDLGRLANNYEARLPRNLRFMTRGLGTRETQSNDLLSLIMFQPDYIHELIELGERDAIDLASELREFFEPAAS